jgi:hypothetical protein
VLDARGVPVGAVKGPAVPGLPRTTLTKPGWPDLPGSEAGNFASAQPVTLPPGTTIYRILAPNSHPAGSYWVEALPVTRAAWRRDLAVKNDWNTNGLYVEYTVPPGPGLRVWRGETGAQELLGTGYALPGGAPQIWMPANTVSPGVPKPTGW